MATAYTQFKYKLHSHYKNCETYEQARANLPDPELWNSRPAEHWYWLCDKVYSNEGYVVCIVMLHYTFLNRGMFCLLRKVISYDKLDIYINFL